MSYNIEILLLKNDGYSINEISNILSFEYDIIENIYNNDDLEIIEF
jgi:hypothetical protein